MSRPYIARYKERKIELKAESAYGAQCDAARLFKISHKKAWEISIVLADIPTREIAALY